MIADFVSFDVLHPQPLLIVISGPSGVGKDSILRALKKRNTPLYFVVTCASRPPRPGEVNGIDYHFVSKEQFEQMIAGGEMIEYANVYNEYKGIPKFEITNAIASGKDTIVRLDVQGASSIRKLYPEALLIFLIPENYEVWYHRLRNRKTETEESLRIRLETAREEMKQINEFDYVVVNAENRLEEAVDTILAIIEAEHHRIPHRKISG